MVRQELETICNGVMEISYVMPNGSTYGQNNMHEMLGREWKKVEYRIDVHRVTKGAHMKYL